MNLASEILTDLKQRNTRLKKATAIIVLAFVGSNLLWLLLFLTAR